MKEKKGAELLMDCLSVPVLASMLTAAAGTPVWPVEHTLPLFLSLTPSHTRSFCVSFKREQERDYK